METDGRAIHRGEMELNSKISGTALKKRRVADTRTDMWADRRAGWRAGGLAGGRVDGRTERRAGGWKDKCMGGRTGGPAGGLAGGRVDGQTTRQTGDSQMDARCYALHNGEVVATDYLVPAHQSTAALRLSKYCLKQTVARVNHTAVTSAGIAGRRTLQL